MPRMDSEKLRGDFILNLNVVIPNINEFKKEDSDLLINILKK
jgi:hypothetical protein